MKDSKEWISISDLMSALMMVFLFIAITFILDVKESDNKTRSIIQNVDNSKKIQSLLYSDLQSKLAHFLYQWDAELLPGLIIRFNNPEVLFEPNSDKLKPIFMSYLDRFFPRYIEILYNKKLRNEIYEIRIEGHTSSEWKGANKQNTYLKNLDLSQKRAKAVLEYVFKLPSLVDKQDWLSSKLISNGMSFTKLIFDDSNNEDRIKSRRVEFRIITNPSQKIFELTTQI